MMVVTRVADKTDTRVVDKEAEEKESLAHHTLPEKSKEDPYAKQVRAFRKKMGDKWRKVLEFYGINPNLYPNKMEEITC